MKRSTPDLAEGDRRKVREGHEDRQSQGVRRIDGMPAEIEKLGGPKAMQLKAAGCANFVDVSSKSRTPNTRRPIVVGACAKLRRTSRAMTA